MKVPPSKTMLAVLTCVYLSAGLYSITDITWLSLSKLPNIPHLFHTLLTLQQPSHRDFEFHVFYCFYCSDYRAMFGELRWYLEVLFHAWNVLMHLQCEKGCWSQGLPCCELCNDSFMNLGGVFQQKYRLRFIWNQGPGWFEALGIGTQCLNHVFCCTRKYCHEIRCWWYIMYRSEVDSVLSEARNWLYSNEAGVLILRLYLYYIPAFTSHLTEL